MLATTRTLLTSLEPLSYRRRLRRVAEWARTAPGRAEICADLREQGPYERLLALIAALATRDAGAIATATHDPQPSIRNLALTASVRAGLPIADVTGRPAAERRRIYRALRRSPRPEIAGTLITEVRAAFGDDEAAALLPGCGAETVRRLLPGMEHALDPERLVRRHERVMLDRVRDRLAAAGGETRRAVWNEVAGAVLRSDPDQAIDLLERFAPEDSLPGGLPAYHKIAKHRASRLAHLMTAQDREAWLRRSRLPKAVLRPLATLPDAELAPIAARIRNLADLLRVLPPARRGTARSMTSP